MVAVSLLESEDDEGVEFIEPSWVCDLAEVVQEQAERADAPTKLCPGGGGKEYYDDECVSEWGWTDWVFVWRQGRYRGQFRARR